MTLRRPIFPPLESSPAHEPGPSLPSSLSSVNPPRRRINYLERISQAYAKLETLPDELCPPSRSTSPLSQSRADLLAEKVVEAVVHAGNNAANPKWTHVARTLRMACTSRLYRGIPRGVRVGEKQKAAVEVGNYHWVLPDTPEEWEVCEERWANRFLGPYAGDGRPSKYWPRKEPDVEETGERQEAKTPTKAEIVRDKVRAWQANVIHVTETVDSEDASDFLTVHEARPRRPNVSEKKQSPIIFPVAKLSVVATSSKTANGVDRSASLPRVSNITPPYELPNDVKGDVPIEMQDPEPARITDLSEMSFLPPSFPPQLDTSTPPNAEKAKSSQKVRTKPPPIIPLRPQHLPGRPPDSRSSLDRLALPLLESSSLPQLTPSSDHPVKRTRPLTPPANHQSLIEHSDHSPLKKQKLDVAEAVSSAPLPPSTPSLSITPPRTPSPLLNKGLGNANGLSLPRTPDQNGLPTLTALLASSRKARPRPRPPSRKAKAAAVIAAANDKRLVDGPLVPAGSLRVAAETRESSPTPTVASRAKTIFSSPASGSSGSPQSTRERPRSPVSPLFSNNFAPPHVSTQHATGSGAGGFGVMAASQPSGNGLGRGSSGMFAMGYNSQFDLEGQIGMVSDLLERDVDFDGWLRDIPEVDADG